MLVLLAGPAIVGLRAMDGRTLMELGEVVAFWDEGPFKSGPGERCERDEDCRHPERMSCQRTCVAATAGIPSVCVEYGRICQRRMPAE